MESCFSFFVLLIVKGVRDFNLGLDVYIGNTKKWQPVEFNALGMSIVLSYFISNTQFENVS